MNQSEWIRALLASRKTLLPPCAATDLRAAAEAEGGCGVIGIASSEKIAGRHLLQSLRQMRNRGNGKGGGIAAAGLVPEEFGVTREVLERDYLFAIAYLDTSVRSEVERLHISPKFEVDHIFSPPHLADFHSLEGLEIQPPEVAVYFVRVRDDAVAVFASENSLASESGRSRESIEEEIVYQNTYSLNRAFYASTGEKRAFVLSHGKNQLVLKMVGYGDDVVRHYQLEDVHAHVWIGHHRYPTKGRVWHPGGAHPFVGMHEALVHNGDFANYSSICEYLAQRNIRPLFLTDTEVSVLVFDLLHRVYGYPLEYVIEALAPTTERDFTLLPREKQEIYRLLQTAHIHGSPDGPWFFLIAQSVPASGASRLIGITDTSMLRPQVFALQQGEASIGFAASEKQAIDAALESLAGEDSRFWTQADLYWNARGGSHTDGGAFLFNVEPGPDGKMRLECTNKFGEPVHVPHSGRSFTAASENSAPAQISGWPEGTAADIFSWTVAQLPKWGWSGVRSFLDQFPAAAKDDPSRLRVIETLTLLLDRRYPTGGLRRSSLCSLFNAALARFFEGIIQNPPAGFHCLSAETESGAAARATPSANSTVLVNARGFPIEGKSSLARKLVELAQAGFRRFIFFHVQGHRFLGNGFGPNSHGVRIDVYGSSGDYLASGLDGAEMLVHGNAQDQLAQIMKDGKLVVFGDVGQTFMYAAKGGQAYILGNAAGRPMINAVGKPRVVINGTCLDYLAESFMAGDPLDGGGFVILNGLAFTEDGGLVELDAPYPGGNLFSLSSGGAIYVRDPHRKVSEDQLNGGELCALQSRDWDLILPYLRENERLFGISVARLLEVEGKGMEFSSVYRKIRPRRVEALQAEEAWVRGNA
jgi:glutamate synthase domain-containing protein 1/glutamate synthase domain-containing protein 3